jgi:ABC-type nitrate/sulfonate/bicarbonate transport system permease component
MDDTAQSGQNKLFSAVLRLNTKMLGMVLGLLFGLAIFIATNWLIIKGGHITPGGEYVVGPHLQLLSQFFIGYRVSFLGSIIGFFYGFALGTLCGAAMGWIYNKIAVFRNSEIKNL